LAYLSLKGIAQVIISDDSDLILFGCKKLFSKMDKNGNGIMTEHDKIKSGFRFNGEENFQKFRW
jgi:exonuclease 1